MLFVLRLCELKITRFRVCPFDILNHIFNKTFIIVMHDAVACQHNAGHLAGWGFFERYNTRKTSHDIFTPEDWEAVLLPHVLIIAKTTVCASYFQLFLIF